jgi:cytochrome d ubiquinol oxidase subunit II
MKAEGELRDKAYHLSWYLLFAMLCAIAAVSIATPFLHIQYTQRWFSWPNIVLTAPVPIAVAGVTVLLLRALANKWDYQPFFLSLACSRCPMPARHQHRILHRAAEHHIWQAAAPESSLTFLLIGVAVLIPLILAIPPGPIGYSAAR